MTTKDVPLLGSLRLLAALSALLITGHAHAAGLSIANIGNNSAAAGAATLDITTTAACPAGNAATLLTAVIANVAINTTTDSTGNAWNAGQSITLSGTSARQRLQFLSARLNAGLPVGATITANYAATTGIKLAAAACIFGAMVVGNPAETEIAPATGTSTSPSLVMTTPALSPAEIDICAYTVLTGAGDTFTNTTGFSALQRVNNSSAINWEYKIVSDFNAVTCAPTLGTSRTWGVSGRGFLQTQGSRALLGVGQ
jgi:hypothetical protein